MRERLAWCWILLIAATFRFQKCHGWAWPSAPMAFQQYPPSSNNPQPGNKIPAQNSIWLQNMETQSRILSRCFASTFLATALVFGSVTHPYDAALAASDETLLFDLSSQDSAIIETRSPPEIKSASSEQALALSKKLKSLNSRMYGAYWCGHCAAQKEVFGKEAFESKNIEYVECSENGKNAQSALCEEKNVNGYPTWEIKNKLYSGERSLEEMETLVRMADATGNNDKAPPRIVASSSDRAMAISKQLEDLDARLFGSYWCAYTFEQKEALGKQAFARIPYVECGKDGVNSQLQLCQEKQVRVVPTWEIKGELYPGGQDLDELEQIIVAANAQSITASPDISSDATTTKSIAGTTASKDTAEEESQKTKDESPSKAKEDTKTSEKTASMAKEEQIILATKEAPPQQQIQNDMPQLSPAITASDNPEVSSSNRAVALATKMREIPDTRIYGAYWDAFTKHQKQILGGEAFEMIPYVECTKDGKNSQTKLCKEKGITAFPTFEIGGKVYAAGERSLAELETLVDKAYESIPKPKAILTAPAPVTTTTENVAPVRSPEPAPLKAPLGPPPIKAKSTERTLALASQMESLHTKMYGAYWCSHCLNQKEVLGKQAFAKIQYIECTKDGKNSQNALCREKGIKSVPTWDINGRLFSGERTLEELEELVKAELQPAPTVEVEKTDTAKTDDKTGVAATATKAKSATTMDDPAKTAPILDAPKTTPKLPLLMPSKEGDSEKLPAAVATLKQEPKVAKTNDKDSTEPTMDAAATTPASRTEASSSTENNDKPEEEEVPPVITSSSSPRAIKVADRLEKFNAKLYGAYWCRYTNAQKERLGKEAFAKIQYIECSQDGKDSAIDICRKMRIQGYPTWEVNGKLYPGDQELDELEEIVEKNLEGL